MTVDAAHANQVALTRPEAVNALSEVITFYQDGTIATPEQVLEHASVVGRGALAVLDGDEFYHVEEVGHNEAFPFERQRNTLLTPYIIGVVRTAEGSAVHLDRVHMNSHETVGIVSVPRRALDVQAVPSPKLMANLQGERYDPLTETQAFGRVIATGAHWVMRALRTAPPRPAYSRA